MNHKGQTPVSCQPVGHPLANALIAPPALGDESATLLSVDLSQGPCGSFHQLGVDLPFAARSALPKAERMLATQ
jgi:hypothetical protein